MSNQSNTTRHTLDDLFKQITIQFQQTRQRVSRSIDKLEADVHQLRIEKKKLLQKLSEQTRRLCEQDLVTLPTSIQRSLKQFNKLLDTLSKTQHNESKTETSINQQATIRQKVELVKNTPVKKKAEVKKKAPVKKKAEVKKKTPVKKKAEVKKKTPVKKKAEVKKKTPVKKKAGVKKKTPVKKKITNHKTSKKS